MRFAKLAKLCFGVHVIATLGLALHACGDDGRAGPHARDGGEGLSAPPNGRDGGGDGPDRVGPGDDAGGVPAPTCGEGAACAVLDPATCGGSESCVFTLPDDGTERRTPQCLPAGGGRDGAPCSDHRDCSAGLDCTADDGSGVCRRYCCAPNQTLGCPSGQVCTVALEDGNGDRTDVYLCDGCSDCDLLDERSCGEGQACYLVPGTDSCRRCSRAGSAGLGAACKSSSNCAPGSACIRTSSGAQRCAALCALETREACPAGETCREVADAQFPAGVGLCL